MSKQWDNQIASISQTLMAAIYSIVKEKERKVFDEFLNYLRKDLNPVLGDEEAVEILAQHILTRPVFDALFQEYKFTSENHVSRSLQNVVDRLNIRSPEEKHEVLREFYDGVRAKAATLTTASEKQDYVNELYEGFFQKAFKRVADLLGIVYTPHEVVDFILHSVNDVLKDEFGCTLSDPGVNITDPFTGTGTFINRLLSSDLIRDEDLQRKYRHEIHAHEITLLAYYIAGVNIEAIYHERMKSDTYEPFQNLKLADTFLMDNNYKKDDLFG